MDCVILRFGGIQSGSNNVSNSSSAVSIKAPSSEWLSGVWGPDSTDHEIYLIIPTEEDESAVKYTLSKTLSSKDRSCHTEQRDARQDDPQRRAAVITCLR